MASLALVLGARHGRDDNVGRDCNNGNFGVRGAAAAAKPLWSMHLINTHGRTSRTIRLIKTYGS